MIPPPAEPPEILTREQAIARLRGSLLPLCDAEHSICHVAAERGIFCRGFRRWDDHEFHHRWKRVLGQSTHLSRPQMERLADVWQLCEQIHHGVKLACDAPAGARGACRGWDEFSNETLAQFCLELSRRAVVVATEFDANAPERSGPTGDRVCYEKFLQRGG